jgi:hypothetical protein
MPRQPREIEEDIRITRTRLSLFEAELKSVLIENCGVKVGDVIMARPPVFGPSALQEAIVRSIDVRSSNISLSPPWLAVSFKKKNGEWAGRKNNVYTAWQKKVGK